uniref:Uncharacterized protein n=1 Tax=Lepeophtheirus salmonis TaxID=72036 RepID=A0A0K2UBF4_LEPSM
MLILVRQSMCLIQYEYSIMSNDIKIDSKESRHHNSTTLAPSCAEITLKDKSFLFCKGTLAN